MRRFSIGKVIAAGTLAFALTPLLATASPAAADSKAIPQEPAAARDAVLSIDQNLLAAWQKGDAKKLASLIAADARIIDGTTAGPGSPAGAAQFMDRAQFLAKAASVRPRTTLALKEERVVRVHGADADVVIVCGILKDTGSPAGNPAVYTAVYVRGSTTWALELYQTSAGEGRPWHYAAPTSAPWSPDELSPDQRHVMDAARGFWTGVIQDDPAMIAKAIADDWLEINGPFTPETLIPPPNDASGASTSRKARYLAGLPEYYHRLAKRAAGDTQAFGTRPNGFRLTPLQIVGLGKPDIRFYGAKGDVAIVTLPRSDSDGEASFGFDFKPHWRLAMYDTYVVAGNPGQDDWQIVHEHFTLREP